MDISFYILLIFSIFCVKIQSIYSIDNLYTSNRNNIYYIENENKYSWFDALAKCASMDMTLATIDTKEKSDEITDLLRKTFSKVNPAWIGGVATGNSHQFVWISTGAKVTFTNWSPAEPSFTNSNEYCLLTGWLNNLQWNDAVCQYQNGIICEYSQHYNTQKEMQAKLQDELAKEQQIQNELDKNQLLLKLLLNYKISHQNNDKGNKSVREVFVNFS